MFLKGTDGKLLILEISISRNVITFFEEDRPLFPLLQSEPMAWPAKERRMFAKEGEKESMFNH